MSNVIRLMYGKRIAKVSPHLEGGTIQAGGTNASLNVTYNYHMFFEEHLGDERLYWLHGKSANQTIPKLERVIDALSSFVPDADYWKPTAGNAKRALSTLLEWARLHPRAIWNVT